MFMQIARFVLLTLLFFVAAGCGGGKPFYPVRGKVVFAKDSAPLDQGWVVFEKTEGESTHSADSPLRPDGSFELRTARPGDGVPTGTYRVLVKPRDRTEVENQTLPPIIDPKFSRFETSGIKFVVEAKPNYFEIKVTKR